MGHDVKLVQVGLSGDYYEILGVSKASSQDTIKRAYRKVASRYHPDLNPGDRQAEESFKKVNEAYAVLGDPRKRVQYDKYGARAFGNGGRPQDHADLSSLGDMLEGIFGEVFRNKKKQIGRDIEFHLDLSFEEAALGAEKEVTVRRPVHKSYAYKGNGAQRSKGGPSSVREELLSVRIPPGVLEGAVRTIRDKGEIGPDGAGDLHIHVHIAPHAIFERQGSDVHCSVPVRYAQAVLGCTLDVPTLHGPVQMRLPPGTESGKVFRLRAKGIPVFGGYGRGDQLVRIFVEVPEEITERQRALLTSLDTDFGTDSHPKRRDFLKKTRELG